MVFVLVFGVGSDFWGSESGLVNRTITVCFGGLCCFVGGSIPTVICVLGYSFCVVRGFLFLKCPVRDIVGSVL